MWGLIVVHSKQVLQFNCVRFNKVSLYTSSSQMNKVYKTVYYILLKKFGLF